MKYFLQLQNSVLFRQSTLSQSSMADQLHEKWMLPIHEQRQMIPKTVLFLQYFQHQQLGQRMSMWNGFIIKISNYNAILATFYSRHLQSSTRLVCIPYPHYDDLLTPTEHHTKTPVHCSRKIEIAWYHRRCQPADLSSELPVLHWSNVYCIVQPLLFHHQMRIPFVCHSKLLRLHLQRPNMNSILLLIMMLETVRKLNEF